ncbi:MAG: GFA family protein [Desulfobacterales bacterium]|nr:GFA family protein [Desulfobacterales bacterium]
MSSKKCKGSCLCGQVSYEAEIKNYEFYLCHCSRCRKITGSAHVSSLYLPSDQFDWISGEDLLVRYDIDEDETFSNCFCKICGSSVPYEYHPEKHMIIPAGTLDEEPDVKPDCNIFWASRAGWYKDPLKLPTYDAYPPEQK